MKTRTKENTPIGTKVVPHAKTTGVEFDKCKAWKKGKEQGFLYVVEHYGGYLYLSSEIDGGCNAYNYSDITLYEEKPKVKKSDLLERLQIEVERLNEAVFGKDLKIDEKPQYEIGATYAFADYEEYFENNGFIIGVLQSFDLTESIPFQRKEGFSWKFARRIEYTFKP